VDMSVEEDLSEEQHTSMTTVSYSVMIGRWSFAQCQWRKICRKNKNKKTDRRYHGMDWIKD